MIGREDLEAALAEMLDLIKDRGLGEKVLDAWMLGVERGGWESMEELREMPFTLVTETRGVNFIEHTLAVTKSALGMAKAQMECYSKMPYEIDVDRLIAGGLLHDVGKLLETERTADGGHRKSRSGLCARHPVSGAILAAEAGLPEEIINVIACHAKEGEGRPQFIETVLVHQADFATFNPLVMMTDGRLIQ